VSNGGAFLGQDMPCFCNGNATSVTIDQEPIRSLMFWSAVPMGMGIGRYTKWFWGWFDNW
jgi:hypothetical protein